MKINHAMLRRMAAGLLGLAVLAVAIGWSSMRPSLARDWIPEHRLLPEIEERGDTVVIHNVRDFRWSTGAEATPAWRREAYDLGTVETVWYVLTPFSRDRRGPAHAFVSFGFRDGRFLAISVEARREQGEQYSVLRGMLRQYEVIYVIGEERDLVQQRVLRDDDVYVYPIRATAAQARALLEDMLRRANALREQPEFYGTIRNNCTTNLLAHVNRIADKPIGYGRRILLPGYSDEVAYERGWIDTTLPLDSARQQFLINGRARRLAAADDYSATIRGLHDD